MNEQTKLSDIKKLIPLWFVAEITHKCPMQCPYCSNPINLKQSQKELNTEQWKNAILQARKLGAVQLGFSGGEPLVRKDLEILVAYAHRLGFYTNLITTGVGFDEKRIKALKKCGLDHIQLSLQSKAQTPNEFFEKTQSIALKKDLAKLIIEYGYPMVVNLVIHKHNIDHIEALISSAIDIGASYIELANTQYYGWAFVNRIHLIPSEKQLQQARIIVKKFQDKYRGKIDIFYVVPDYNEKTPKPCSCGWGNLAITISPDGTVMPCLSANVLPGILLPNIKNHSLDWIWHESGAFNKYRGEDWMKEPCASCDKRKQDFGGCRCQAYLITGDATNTDPVCELSPHNHLVESIVSGTQVTNEKILMRNMTNSKYLLTK